MKWCLIGDALPPQIASFVNPVLTPSLEGEGGGNWYGDRHVAMVLEKQKGDWHLRSQSPDSGKVWGE